MGKLSIAAKITHVPTMLMSEQPGRLHGKRRQAIDGHKEIARRARAAGVDTVVIIDTHWMVNAGYHVNANARFAGTFTSHEFPHFIQGLSYDYPGNPQLGEAIAEMAGARNVFALAHQIDSLHLEYGTLVPLRYMTPEADMKVVSIAGWCAVHSLETSRQFGAAIRDAIEDSGANVMLLASGSLSHKIWDNELYEANNGTFTISSEFNRQMDLRVLELWQRAEIGAFLAMLPEYAEKCVGEGGMHDTAMLFGALGWDAYKGAGEVIGEYFPSSGTGQVNVVFPV